MNDLQNALWTVWLLYWFSAAFAGTFTAIFTAWGIRKIYRKIKWALWVRKRDRLSRQEYS
jgi:hypothetical protein